LPPIDPDKRALNRKLDTAAVIGMLCDRSVMSLEAANREVHRIIPTDCGSFSAGVFLLFCQDSSDYTTGRHDNCARGMRTVISVPALRADVILQVPPTEFARSRIRSRPRLPLLFPPAAESGSKPTPSSLMVN
jgi:hypothetical protein